MRLRALSFRGAMEWPKFKYCVATRMVRHRTVPGKAEMKESGASISATSAAAAADSPHLGLRGGGFFYTPASSIARIREDLEALRVAPAPPLPTGAAATPEKLQPSKNDTATKAKTEVQGEPPLVDSRLERGKAIARKMPDELKDGLELRLRCMQRIALGGLREVVRGPRKLQSEKIRHYVKLVPELDPSEQYRRAASFERHREALRTRGNDVSIAEHVASMTDEQLREAMDVGAINPEDLMDEGCSDEAEALPNEDLATQSECATIRAAEELGSVAAGDPTDAAASALQKARSGLNGDITERELQALEEHEKASSHWLWQTNRLLSYVARKDAAVRHSIDALDRARRAALRDADFQEAVAYARQLERAQRQSIPSRGSPRPSSGDVPRFFGSKYEHPPPRAGSGVPSEPTPKHAPFKRSGFSSLIRSRFSRK